MEDSGDGRGAMPEDSQQSAGSAAAGGGAPGEQSDRQSGAHRRGRGNGRARGRAGAQERGRGDSQDQHGSQTGDEHQGRGRGRRRAQAPPQEEGRHGPERPPAWARKRYSAWCFTCFDFSIPTTGALRTWYDKKPREIHYLIIGFEVCPVTRLPHLQCYVELVDRERLADMKSMPVPNNFHWEPRWSTSTYAVNYCRKDRRYWEVGIHQDDRRDQARRANSTLWTRIREDIQSHDSFTDVLMDKSLTAYVSSRMLWAATVFNARPRSKFYLDLDAPGFQWQGMLARFLVCTTPDDRTVHFVVDTEGNRGKSKVVKWLVANKNALVMPNEMKAAANIWDGHRICLSDCPRDTPPSSYPYKVMESLKDGVLVNTKYQVQMRVSVTPPHCVVLCNTPPELWRLTADRINIIDLSAIYAKATPVMMSDLFPYDRFPEAEHIFKNGDPFRDEPLRRPEAVCPVCKPCGGHEGCQEGAPPYGQPMQARMFFARCLHSRLQERFVEVLPPRPGILAPAPEALDPAIAEAVADARLNVGDRMITLDNVWLGDTGTLLDTPPDGRDDASDATTLEMDPWREEPNFPVPQLSASPAPSSGCTPEGGGEAVSSWETATHSSGGTSSHTPSGDLDERFTTPRHSPHSRRSGPYGSPTTTSPPSVHRVRRSFTTDIDYSAVPLFPEI